MPACWQINTKIRNGINCKIPSNDVGLATEEKNSVLIEYRRVKCMSLHVYYLENMSAGIKKL